MRGEALQRTPSVTAHVSPARPADFLDVLSLELRLFASVLLCRPKPTGDQAERALEWASRTEARRLIETGRASAGTERTLAFKLLYGGARAEAAAMRPVDIADVPRGARWERALGGLATLRHRQRAVLVLHVGLGICLADVADIVGVREPEAHRVVEAATAALLRTLGEPLDAARALRIGAAHFTKLPDAVGPMPADRPEPVRLPRAVTRAFVGPPVASVTVDILPRRRHEVSLPATAVENLLASIEGVPADMGPEPVTPEDPPAVPESPKRVRRFDAGSLAVAAAAVLIVVGVLLPASERGVMRPATASGRAAAISGEEPAPSQVMGVRRVAPVRPVLTVRSGDSLWSIASSRLGDPYRWPEIWRLNRGRVMQGSVRFSDPDVIRPRWRLILPR